MDGPEIAQRRLVNQHLVGEPLADPVAVVRQLGAVQAQEYAVAKWSLAQRCGQPGDADVARAVDSGAILRTHALRPTWHFLAAEDIGWIQALTGPRVHVVNGHYYRLHGLDEAMAARTNRVITTALRGGNHLTRTELAGALAAAGLEATGNRLAYVVIRAELDGLIANGPMRGKQHTYALIAERVPHPWTPDEPLAELTRRFFTSHGPATVKDFAWWSSLTLTQIRQGLALVGSALVSEVVGDLTYWFAPGRPPGPEPSPRAHVLQAYDEYAVAYTESRSNLNLAGADLGQPGANLLVHLLLLDGQLVGSWRRSVGPAGIAVAASPARPLTGRQRRAIEAALREYGRFVGLPVTVTWT